MPTYTVTIYTDEDHYLSDIGGAEVEICPEDILAFIDMILGSKAVLVVQTKEYHE